MDAIKLLILDFGRYPADSNLQPVLTAINDTSGTLTMRLDPERMNGGEWDEVIENLMNTQRCITV